MVWPNRTSPRSTRSAAWTSRRPCALTTMFRSPARSGCSAWGYPCLPGLLRSNVGRKDTPPASDGVSPQNQHRDREQFSQMLPIVRFLRRAVRLPHARVNRGQTTVSLIALSNFWGPFLPRYSVANGIIGCPRRTDSMKINPRWGSPSSAAAKSKANSSSA